MGRAARLAAVQASENVRQTIKERREGCLFLDLFSIAYFQAFLASHVF